MRITASIDNLRSHVKSMPGRSTCLCLFVVTFCIADSNFLVNIWYKIDSSQYNPLFFLFLVLKRLHWETDAALKYESRQGMTLEKSPFIF